jgi:2,4-diketo-3-deoxy-L-fuconate hydrolase
VKLLRVGAKGAERPAALDESGRLRDLSDALPGADYTGAFFAGQGIERIRAALAGDDLPVLDMAAVRVGPPIARPGKVVCIGLNYRDHAAESGAEIPAEPVVFMKASSTVVGPFDEVLIPRNSVKTDWEVELAIVIGTRARYVSKKDAFDFVAGYCVANDVSEREFQLERAGQWTKGKGCETFGPLGPWLVTTDEIPAPQSLSMWLDVNGERMQKGSTRTMIFHVAHIVSYVSQFMVIEPGDVIATGTPPGVGQGKKPPKFLKAGDVVSLGIEGLGEQRCKVVRFRS